MLHRALLTFTKHLDLSTETSNPLTCCLVWTLRLALLTIACHSSWNHQKSKTMLLIGHQKTCSPTEC
uniref:Uncharacterized protein n=1 Tax=Arundo donax TaxID=35708 RepID=A0A0A9FL83_ARUDO